MDYIDVFNDLRLINLKGKGLINYSVIINYTVDPNHSNEITAGSLVTFSKINPQTFYDLQLATNVDNYEFLLPYYPIDETEDVEVYTQVGPPTGFINSSNYMIHYETGKIVFHAPTATQAGEYIQVTYATPEGLVIDNTVKPMLINLHPTGIALEDSVDRETIRVQLTGLVEIPNFFSPGGYYYANIEGKIFHSRVRIPSLIGGGYDHTYLTIPQEDLTVIPYYIGQAISQDEMILNSQVFATYD